jgi:hypothetical protein
MSSKGLDNSLERFQTEEERMLSLIIARSPPERDHPKQVKGEIEVAHNPGGVQ